MSDIGLFDISPWIRKEDDMTPEQDKMLREVYDSIVKRKPGTPGQLIHDYAKGAKNNTDELLKRT